MLAAEIMAFEKYTTERLKRAQKILLIVSIIGLAIMCFATGVALYQVTHNDNSVLINLIPTVFLAFIMIPVLFSIFVGSEIKKRNKNKS